MNEPYKLFFGERFYPLGGYEDFKGNFVELDHIFQWITDNSEDIFYGWAHVVYKDKIVLSGKIDTDNNKNWIWESDND